MKGRHGAPLVNRTRFLGMSPDGEIAGPQTHHTFSRRELVNRNLGTRLLPTGTKPVPRSFIAYSKKEEDAHEIIPCYLGERRQPRSGPIMEI